MQIQESKAVEIMYAVARRMGSDEEMGELSPDETTYCLNLLTAVIEECAAAGLVTVCRFVDLRQIAVGGARHG